MESVFVKTVWVHAKDRGIRFVFSKQKLRLRSRTEAVRTQLGVFRDNASIVLQAQTGLNPIAAPPAPRISKPKVGQQIEIGCLRAAIEDSNTNQRVKLGCFDVFNEDIEVPIVIKDTGVKQFIFVLLLAGLAIGVGQIRVRKFRLRILIKHLQVGMTWRAIQVVIVLFDIFAVIAFVAGQSKQTFLQNRVFPVPHPQRKAEPLLIITVSTDPVFAPSVSVFARRFVIEELPSLAVFAVVLTNGAPLPLAEVRAPDSPVAVSS